MASSSPLTVWCSGRRCGISANASNNPILLLATWTAAAEDTTTGRPPPEKSPGQAWQRRQLAGEESQIPSRMEWQGEQAAKANGKQKRRQAKQSPWTAMPGQIGDVVAAEEERLPERARAAGRRADAGGAAGGSDAGALAGGGAA